MQTKLAPLSGFLSTIALSLVPCWAQVTGEVRPGEIVASTGEVLTIAIDVDLGSSGKLLGSYGAILLWDPTALQYLGDTVGGQPPFDTGVVNRIDVGDGVLRFADASPIGAGGRVNILNVTFLINGRPCAPKALDLEFTSLGAPGPEFENLLPILVIQDGIINITDFFLNLSVLDPDETILQWSAIQGAVSYDVIRGNTASLSVSDAVVNLGSVVCIENDSLDTTTGTGTEPANPDIVMPSLGEAFFYLARLHDGVMNNTYGFTDLCSSERIPVSGDCP